MSCDCSNSMSHLVVLGYRSIIDLFIYLQCLILEEYIINRTLQNFKWKPRDKEQEEARASAIASISRVSLGTPPLSASGRLRRTF